MADVGNLAVVGVVVEERGGDAAARALDKVTASGTAAEKATQGLSRAQQELIARSERAATAAQNVDIANRKAVDAQLREIATVRALAREMGVLADVEARMGSSARDVGSHLAAVTEERRRLSAELRAGVTAQTASTSSAIAGAAGLGRLRESVTSMAAAALGAAPGVTQLTSVIGSMALGSGVMVAVLAGMAALGFAWDKISEKSRKAAQEQADAIKRIDDLRKRERQGPGGQTVDDVETFRKQIAQDQARIEALRRQSSIGFGAGKGVVDQAAKAAIEARAKEITELQARIEFGERKINEAIAESSNARAAQQISDLARLVAAGQASANEVRTAKALIATLESDLAAATGDPRKTEDRARMVEQLKELRDAFTPKKDADTRNLAADLRTRESIAAAEERRVDAARALAAAAAQGQAVYDREVRSQALKNELLETERRIRESFLDANGKLRAGTEAQMQAEIARTRAAIQTRDALGDSTRASLDIGKAEDEVAQLRAKAESYDRVGAAAKDAAIEVGYHERVTAASAVADEAKKQRLIELAEEWRRWQRTVAEKDATADAMKKVAEQQKQAAEEAMREQERRARHLARTISSAISGALDELGQKGANFFQTWWDAGKRGLNRMIGDAVGQLASEKFGNVFGVGPGAAATKQVTAGAAMLNAAQLQLQAAMLMVQAGTWSTAMNGGVADASKVFNPVQQPGALSTSLGYAAIGAGGALTGYGLGGALYSQSHGAFGNYARGALGGAGAGALAGAAIGSVIPGIGTAIGAVVGGAAGLIGGLLGIGSASKEAAARTRELRASLVDTMDALRAEVSKDSLAASIAQVHAQSAQIRKQIEDAYAGGGANSDTVRERNTLLAEAYQLEQRRIEQLREEAAALSRYFTEDLRVRELRAQGRDKEAADLEFRNRQQRELDEYRRTHDMTQKANQEQYAYLQQVQALEKNTAAVNQLTTTMRGAPTGFKTEDLNRYIQEFAKAQPWPGQFQVPTNPFLPPMTPSGAPQLSRTGTVATAPVQVTFAAGAIQISGTNLSAEEMGEKFATSFVRKLDGVKERTLGGNATRADALERIPS